MSVRMRTWHSTPSSPVPGQTTNWRGRSLTVWKAGTPRAGIEAGTVCATIPVTSPWVGWSFEASSNRLRRASVSSACWVERFCRASSACWSSERRGSETCFIEDIGWSSSSARVSTRHWRPPSVTPCQGSKMSACSCPRIPTLNTAQMTGGRNCYMRCRSIDSRQSTITSIWTSSPAPTTTTTTRKVSWLMSDVKLSAVIIWRLDISSFCSEPAAVTILWAVWQNVFVCLFFIF